MSRQRLGQHFLTSASVLERIAAAVCPAREAQVIEIGPGRGALTAKLLQRADRVIAIEVDGALVEYLRAQFAGAPLEIVHADVLVTDLAQWGRVPIAGNLPYYITSPILEHAARVRAPQSVFLMQKEVAQRLVAKPGTRDYGFLTVQTALSSEVEHLFDVKPGSFLPPPKVDSAVVRLTPREGPPPPQDLIRFVGNCFAHKRKTLRNNLAPVYGKDVIASWQEASLRAEQLEPGQFVDLWKRLAATDEHR